MTKKAIDISNWQGPVSEKVFRSNKENIPCVILRSSVTMFKKQLTIEKDKSFEKDIKAAHAAGMAIGIYHYSQAKSESEAIKEADFCLSIIKGHAEKITLPVAFDYEFGRRLTSGYAKSIGKQRVKQICDAFCRRTQAAGFKAMVYANLSTLNGYIASDIYKFWPIWVAQYHSRCDYKHEIYMWQYTSGGKVPGISGKIDMDWLYGYEYKQNPAPEEKGEYYPGPFPKLPKRGWFTSGDKGEEVKKLQKFLNWYGDYGLDIDGEVGRKTMNAVKYYEGREGIKPIDSLFGEKCLARAKTVRR